MMALHHIRRSSHNLFGASDCCVASTSNFIDDSIIIPPANLVPRASPLQNGRDWKRPLHRLVTCPVAHPKILGLIIDCWMNAILSFSLPSHFHREKPWEWGWALAYSPLPPLPFSGIMLWRTRHNNNTYVMFHALILVTYVIINNVYLISINNGIFWRPYAYI